MPKILGLGSTRDCGCFGAATGGSLDMPVSGAPAAHLRKALRAGSTADRRLARAKKPGKTRCANVLASVQAASMALAEAQWSRSKKAVAQARARLRRAQAAARRACR